MALSPERHFTWYTWWHKTSEIMLCFQEYSQENIFCEIVKLENVFYYRPEEKPKLLLFSR